MVVNNSPATRGIFRPSHAGGRSNFTYSKVVAMNNTGRSRCGNPSQLGSKVGTNNPMSQNWRTNATLSNLTANVQQMSLGTSNFSAVSCLTNGNRDGTKVGVSPAKVSLGDIINAPHVELLGDLRIPVGDPSRTESTIGPIQTKERYMIIIAKFLRHCIALPLFTHSGNGIENKPAGVQAQYMALKMETDSSETLNNRTPHEALDVRFAWTMKLKNTSHVNLMAPIAIDYKQVNSIAGQLSVASCEVLAETYKKLMNQAVDESLY